MKITAMDPGRLIDPEGNVIEPFFRLSGIGWCHEKQEHKAAGHEEPPPDPASARRMEIGHMMEDSILAAAENHYGQPIFSRQEQVALKIEHNGETIYWLGHIDGMIRINGMAYIVDAKSTAAFAFRKYEKLTDEEMAEDRTIGAYKAQLGAYALATKCDGIILAIRNRDTNSFDVAWEEMYLDYTMAEVESYVERAALQYFDPSAAQVEPWECRYCGFKPVCHNVRKEEKAPNKAYELLEQYRRSLDNHKSQQFDTVADYEATKKELDKMLKAARAELKDLPTPERRPMHEGFKLSWSKTDRLTITDTRK